MTTCTLLQKPYLHAQISKSPWPVSSNPTPARSSVHLCPEINSIMPLISFNMQDYMKTLGIRGRQSRTPAKLAGRLPGPPRLDDLLLRLSSTPSRRSGHAAPSASRSWCSTIDAAVSVDCPQRQQLLHPYMHKYQSEVEIRPTADPRS